MKKLILIRAGSTAWQEAIQDDLQGCPCDSPICKDDVRLQGTVPLPLSKADKEALCEIAHLVGEHQPDVIYNSGNESSGTSAEYLTELWRVKNKKTPLLRELDCGLWQGLKIKEIKKRYCKAYRQWRKDPVTICPPQGETLISAGERVCESLRKISRKNKDKTVVVVAAPIIAALIECVLERNGLDQFWHIADKSEPLRIFEGPGENDFHLPESPDEEGASRIAQGV